MATFPPIAENGDPHVEGENTWIYQDGVWLKQSPQVSTDNVALLDPSNPADSLTAYPQTLPEVPADTTTQYDVNRWFVNALTHLDTQFEDGAVVAGIHVGEDPPDDPANGTLWFDSSPEALTLLLYYNPDPDKTGIWIPAAPPVSAIEEINQLLGSLGEDVDALELRIYDLNTVGLEPPDPVQDGYIWKNTNPEENRAFIYDGTYPGGSWQLLNQVTKISDTSPANPVEGDLWYEPTTTKALSVYAGGQWVQLTVGADGLERIEDIEADQATQDGRLDVLENKVNALEGGIFDDQWTFEVELNSPRAGEFTLLTGGTITTDFTQATTLVLSTESESGRTYTFDNITVNDVIRINTLDGGTSSSVEYKVAAIITPGAYTVTYVIGTGTGIDEQAYGFTFLQQFDPAGLATIAYVDAQDDLKVDKSGDTVQGTLTVSSQGFPNDDGVRFYMKGNDGATNLTLFPSGVVTGKNVIRVNKDSGDCFQIRDSSGGAVKWKVDADGVMHTSEVFLTGGNSASTDERVIDVQSGQAGRLAYNGLTKLSWGASNVWVGSTATTGEATQAVSLNLQGNKIVNVSELEIELSGATAKKFSIKGEQQDGTVSEDWFYAYKNADGTPDAMNYNGKMDNNANLVNKKYVDDAVGAVSTDEFVQKSGDTLTGSLTFNAATLGSNGMVNFNKAGNNDVQYKGSWIVGFQGNDTPLIKLNAPLDLNNNKITNLDAPTADKDAVNRKSLEGAKIVASSSGNAKSGGFYYSSGRLFYKV